MGVDALMAGRTLHFMCHVCCCLAAVVKMHVRVFVCCMPPVQATGAVYWDAVGSIAVSALLGVVAITLIQRNRKWLIGKSMPKVSELSTTG